MAWASVEAREARSKISFVDRLGTKDPRKVVAKVLRWLYVRSVGTQWRRNTARLTIKYAEVCGEAEPSEAVTTTKENGAVQTKMNKGGEKLKTFCEIYMAQKFHFSREDL